MNFKSREKLLASVAALSLLGISPQQTFAAQITTNQAVQQTKKIQGKRIKLRCPPKVLTGTLHPSLPSIFSG